MEINIEKVILANLLENEDYARKVIPYLKGDYFSEKTERILYELINYYINKYNKIPNKDILNIELSKVKQIDQKTENECKKIIEEIKADNENLEWLVDQTEDFCKNKALGQAIVEAYNIWDGKEQGNHSKEAIPSILENALAVSFDNHIGHDYLDNWEERYDFYHKKEKKIPFDIDLLNIITDGGLSPKTLTVVIAGTGVGKSFFMCHCAAANLMMGKNVLYITMEMAEEKIAERIDANLLNVPIKELKSLPKPMFEEKILRVKGKTLGKLKIKEYPTASAGSANFRHLINELRLKQKFIPDIIYIDYINICCSSRMKMGTNVNSYQYIKAISEELRGLAVEFGVPVVTATQTNRNGIDNSDIDLTNTSESIGLPFTTDLMFALSQDENLEKLEQMLVKQLKNRYGPLDYYRRFFIGADKSRMRLYDLEEDAQESLVKDTPVMDNTRNGEADNTFFSNVATKFDSNKMKGFL